MSRLFPHLFSPFKIKGKRFKNRLFMAAHGTGYAEDGGVGERALEYYRARISEGIGLLITEATHVVPIAGQNYAQLDASSDDCIPRFKRLADLCREHDCRYFAQIYHEGRARAHSLDGSEQVALAPSAIPDERFHIMPRAMTVAMIDEFTGHFAAATRRLRAAGMDGVEILVGMGYLFSQFLSPRTNQRKDAYGGSPEARLRFLSETLGAMRAEAGDDFLIGIRIAAEEHDPDGLRPKDTTTACAMLDAAGLVDFVNVTVSGTHGLTGASYIVPPMFVGTGHTLDLAQAVREAVSVPVMTVGRINQPQEAERAVASGQTDMVGMVRALIADPEFVTKAQADRPDDIRACIACNQACIGHRHQGFGVSCIQFPESGREIEFGVRVPAVVKKNVAVIGGGPGGMKAAAVAAERGHNVTLYEKANRLGGQALLAQALPGREEFGGIVTNLECELARHGVEIRKGVEVSAEQVLSWPHDAVILATGATPRIPAGAFEDAHVVTAWDILQNKANVGRSIVIADWRADWIGPGIAEMLSAQGCAVQLCVNAEMMGEKVQSYVRTHYVGRLKMLGVPVTPYVRLFGADADTVYFQHVITGEAIEREAETLVVSCGHDSDTGLLDALEGKVPELHAIGDCLSPRTAEEAVFEGLKVGSAV